MTLATRLERTVGSIDLRCEGAEQIFPPRHRGVQAGDAVVITAYGRIGEALRCGAYEVNERIRGTVEVPVDASAPAHMKALLRHASFEAEVASSEQAAAWGSSQQTSAAMSSRPSQRVRAPRAVERVDPGSIARCAKGEGQEHSLAGLLRFSWVGQRTSSHGATRLRISPETTSSRVALTDRLGRGVTVSLPENPDLIGRETLIRSAPATAGAAEAAEAAGAAETAESASTARTVTRASGPRGGGSPHLENPPGSRVRTSPVQLGDAERTQRGTFGAVVSMLAWGDSESALQMARVWRRHQPSSVLPLVALGVVADYVDDEELAGRAFGSLVDLYPSEATRDVSRASSGARHLGAGSATCSRRRSGALPTVLGPAVSSVPAAVQGRLRWRGDAARVAQGITGGPRAWRGSSRSDARDRGGGSLVLGGWRSAAPESVADVDALAAELGVPAARGSREVIVLSWDGARVDLDLHVRDDRGEHAYYRRLRLPGGGILSGDGRGRLPYEAFSSTASASAGVEQVDVAVHANGPMGLASGSLDVLRFVPGEGLTVRRAPFITTRPRAELGLAVRSDATSDANAEGRAATVLPRTTPESPTPEPGLLGRRGPDVNSLR